MPNIEISDKKIATYYTKDLNSKVTKWIEFALQRMGECAPTTQIRMEIRSDGAKPREADTAIECARYILNLDPDWQSEMIAGIRLGLSDMIKQYNDMMNRAKTDVERAQYAAMKLKAYDTMIKLLTKHNTLDISASSDQIKDIIFQTYE